MALQLIEWVGRGSVVIFLGLILYFVARLLFPRLPWWRTRLHGKIVQNIGNVDPTPHHSSSHR
jgi:hypothetical protein